MTEPLIRNATEQDLARVGEIWYEAATEGEANPPAFRGVPTLYRHELATQELMVLERDREVVAYGAVINRGPIAFLADLFVASAHRSAGFGQRLLRAMLPTDAALHERMVEVCPTIRLEPGPPVARIACPQSGRATAHQ